MKEMLGGFMPILEKNVALSKSLIWDLQRAYYERMGPSAWDEDIPFFVTSNAYSAHLYAQTFASAIRDSLSAERIHPKAWLNILELGAGSGTFSFHLHQALSKAFNAQA